MKWHWPTRVVLKYALFQIPDFALMIIILFVIRSWVDIPPWIIGGIVAFWVVKDLIMFPYVRRAYDQRHSSAADSMVGMQGIVKDRLAPSGYIQVRGELWKAEIRGGDQPIEKGARVQIREVRGLTLSVQPVDTENNG